MSAHLLVELPVFPLIEVGVAPGLKRQGISSRCLEGEDEGGFTPRVKAALSLPDPREDYAWVRVYI